MKIVRTHLTFSSNFKRKKKYPFVNPYPAPDTLCKKSNNMSFVNNDHKIHVVLHSDIASFVHPYLEPSSAFLSLCML